LVIRGSKEVYEYWNVAEEQNQASLFVHRRQQGVETS